MSLWWWPLQIPRPMWTLSNTPQWLHHHHNHKYTDMLLGREKRILNARWSAASRISLFCTSWWWCLGYLWSYWDLFVLGELVWPMSWPGARCATLSSGPAPHPCHRADTLPQGFTLLLLHGGEILKGKCAHRRSPESVSFHDGFKSSSGEGKVRK